MKKMLVLMLLSLASSAYGELYTWSDGRGTVFYTNSVYEIPARYLSKARVLDVATGKKTKLDPTQLSGAGVPPQPTTAAPTPSPTPAVAPPVAQAPAISPRPVAPQDISGATAPSAGAVRLPMRKRRHFRSDDQ